MKERTPPKKMATKIIKLLKKENIDDNYLKKVFEHIRNDLDIHRDTKNPKKLPELLTEQEMKNFYESVFFAAEPSHMIMIKLLIFTGVRNSELVNICLKDIDLKELKINIRSGKGSKDRVVPIPESFRGELAQYLAVRKKIKTPIETEDYLFITNRKYKFSTRWVREIIRRYAEKAGIKKRIYPHLFRHQLLTYLTKEKLIDSKIQLISGHSDRDSLAIYQDLSLADVENEYQEAMKKFPIK